MKDLGSFQPHSRCHKGRQDTWGDLAKQRSGTSTLQAKMCSGLSWREFSLAFPECHFSTIEKGDGHPDKLDRQDLAQDMSLCPHCVV